MKEKKRDPWFFDHVSYVFFNEKVTNGLFLQQNVVENFISLLKCRQRTVDLITSEKSLVFVAIGHRKFHLYEQLSYTKISYLLKNMHLWKDAASLHFRLKESSENMIFL